MATSIARHRAHVFRGLARSPEVAALTLVFDVADYWFRPLWRDVLR
jgi:hypothetical protein